MKKELRNQITHKRNSLSSQEISFKSNQIFNKLKDMEFYKEAKRVMLFMSFNNEVLTEPIIKDLINNQKQVFIPITIPKTKELIISELIDLDEDLEIGTFGVPEPKKDNIRPTSPHNIDLVIVPGLVFDPRGYRIGYGAGYYDRFLPQIPDHVHKVSLAFNLQIIENVPNNDYDIPVDHIITESQYIKCKVQ